ncbi:MAG: response regulator [bacterium]|nr:response regulator [bacterium]
MPAQPSDQKREQPAVPEVQNGFLDLRHWDFRNSGPVDLSGDWEFFWRKLRLPETIAARRKRQTGAGGSVITTLRVPAAWNGQSRGGELLPGQGYGTYRVRILLPREFTGRPPLAVFVPPASTSMRVFVNEKLLLQRGRVGFDAETSEPAFQPALIAPGSIGNEMILTVQVANFTHSKGGLWVVPRLGAEADLRMERAFAFGVDLFLWGALLIMGCYHLILYALRPADRSPLYFGILCLLVIVRVLVTGDRWLVQNVPGIPFDVYYRLEYLSFYLGLPAFGLFIWNAFPKESNRWLMRAILSAGFACSAVVVLFSPAVFTATLIYYQGLTIFAGLYAVVIGVWAFFRGRQGATLFVIGWLIFFAAVVHDILGANLIIQAPYLTPFALFIFFFAQAAMLAIRFTSSFFRAEELSKRLGQTERQYRRMIEEATEGIFLFERDGWIITANRALAQMLGYDSAEDLLAETSRDARRRIFASESGWVAFAQALGAGAKQERIRDFAAVFLHRDGSQVHVAVNGQAVADIDTGLIRYQGMVRDITEQRKLEEMRIARDAAEAASRSKSQFLANMSHEIRTPMNAILGMADLLAEGPGAREQKKYITILQGAGETLLALINDILDLAKVEAGRIELERVNFNLVELVESTVEIMANEAHKKGLEISHRIDPEVASRVLGDPTRVRQVLVNLLGNAIKFTEAGSVSVEVVSVQGDPLTCAFRVRDTGIGIPPEKQERIFDAFSQADNSTTREFGGTGLGLTISKRLAELMQGDIELESEAGRGSMFSLIARFESGTAIDADDSDQAQVDLTGTRILVVDDVALNRITFRETLQACGAQVSVVAGGAEALAELERDSGSKAYDLILLDYHMPGMDGLETARRLAANSTLRDVPIIAVTSDHLEGTAEKFHALGVAAHLFKPVKRSALLGTARQVLSRDGHLRSERLFTDANDSESDPGTLAAGKAGQRVLRLLVAEDNEDNQVLIKAFLKDAPVTLELAANGAEAFEKFRDGDYDLILMDMQMPIIDGYEATRRIRRLEAERRSAGRTGSIPIVALTAHAMREEIAQILDAGCDAHLAKPVKKARLLETIESYGKI